MLESLLTGEDGGMAGETAPLSAPLVACYQWATQSLLGPYLDKITNMNLNIDSMMQLDMGFTVKPEFTYTDVFTIDECMSFLSQDLDEEKQSLVNPFNMHTMYFTALKKE